MSRAVILCVGLVVASCGSPVPSISTIVVQQQGSDGPAVPVDIIDETGSLSTVRGATQDDEGPFIEGEVEPRIGAVPADPTSVRVLWGGGGCETRYRVVITLNGVGGLHFDVSDSLHSTDSCDSLGIRRGIVVTLSGPVDPRIATGTMHRAP